MANKRRTLIFLGLLLTAFLTTTCFAATYYVDATNGNDGNNGLSEAVAWKTIAKVNVSSFAPGDQILFKRGEGWREQLTVPSSGAAGRPLTFGAYGNGISPTINGSDQVLGADTDWIFRGGNVWRKQIGSVPPNAVIFDLTQIGRNDGLLNTQYKWSYAAPNLDVYSVGNPTAFYNSIEVSRRERALYGWHKNYITIQDLTFTKAQHQGIFDLGGSNWTIVDVTVSYNCYEGIRLYGQDAVNNINNSVVRGCTAAYNGDVGLYAGDYGINGSIESSIAHHNCWAEAHDTNAGIKIWGMNLKYFLIRNNTSYSNGIASGVARGAGIWVDNTGGGHQIQYNAVHDNQFVGIYMEKESNANITAYNIAYNENGTLDAYHGCGIRLSDNVRNQKVFNNTVYNCKIGIAVFGTWPLREATCMNNEIRNNLVHNPSARALAVWAGGENDGVYGSGNIYSHNSFGAEFVDFIQWGTQKYHSTYAAWQLAYGSPTYSISSDPQLVDPANYNFSLRSSSPCVDKGINIGQSNDIFGTSVPLGIAVDIGAVELAPFTMPRNLRVQQPF